MSNGITNYGAFLMYEPVFQRFWMTRKGECADVEFKEVLELANHMNFDYNPI